MEAFMDHIWMKTVDLIFYVKDLLDVAFGPANLLGPAIAVSSIAFVTVLLTKFLSRVYRTKRHRALKKEFQYWYELRQEALRCEDKEKAKLLAKNIDQAKLNRVYYDYFFESLLSNILTKYLPILIFAAYVNESYNPKKLTALFGRDHVFRFTFFGGETIPVGGIFWFVLSLIGIYLLWYVAKKGVKGYLSYRSKNSTEHDIPKYLQPKNQSAAS